MATRPDPTGQPDPAASSVRTLVLALYLSGVVTIVVAVVLGIAIAPILFAIAALGVGDFVIARMYATGVIGPLAARRRAEPSGDAATVAEADPSYNPYARED